MREVIEDEPRRRNRDESVGHRRRIGLTFCEVRHGPSSIVSKHDERSAKAGIILRTMFAYKRPDALVEIGRRIECLRCRVIESDEGVSGEFAAVLDALEQTRGVRRRERKKRADGR